jgi:hypothetical protein
VTDDFVDFIEQLWQCEDKYRMAETFISHPWLHTTSGITEPAQQTPSDLLIKSVTNQPDKTVEGYLFYKMREKKAGRRTWHRKWGIVRHNMLLMYPTPDEDTIDNQELCEAINLRNKNIFIYTMGHHDFMCGLQDTILQQTVVWFRFDDEVEYSKWKEFLTLRHDEEVAATLNPAPDMNQMMSNVLAPKSSNFASSLASNLANNIVAGQYQQNIPIGT